MIEFVKLPDGVIRKDSIKRDIKEAKSYGMDCDKAQWLKLLNRIEEVI